MVALLLIAYGMSDNTGVQVTFKNARSLACRESVEPVADRSCLQ